MIWEGGISERPGQGCKGSGFSTLVGNKEWGRTNQRHEAYESQSWAAPAAGYSFIILLHARIGNLALVIPKLPSETSTTTTLLGLHRVIYIFEDGPDAWKATKDKDFWGWDIQPSLLANDGPPKIEHGFVVNTATCWYEYQGELYIYQNFGAEQGSDLGFWKATAEDKAWLEFLRQIKRADRDRR